MSDKNEILLSKLDKCDNIGQITRLIQDEISILGDKEVSNTINYYHLKEHRVGGYVQYNDTIIKEILGEVSEDDYYDIWLEPLKDLSEKLVGYIIRGNYCEYNPSYEFDELYTEDIAENEEWFTHTIKTISF